MPTIAYLLNTKTLNNAQQVITLLKEIIQLPNFVEERNWTSCLRDYGGEHRKFTGTEVSDIVYPDLQGVFTGFLRTCFEQSGGEEAPSWLKSFPEKGPWPTYLIEVKTTTSVDHSTPFKASGHQYDTVSA